MTSRAASSFEAIGPSSYLTLAAGLAEMQDAAATRSAVDRAYYAAFLYHPVRIRPLCDRGGTGIARGRLKRHSRLGS